MAIEPLETNTIDLLDLALAVNADLPAGNLGVTGLPGGDATWHKVLEKQNEGSKQVGTALEDTSAMSIAEANSSEMELA